MIAFIGKRFLWSIFVLWVVVTLVFILTNAIGDPASATLGPRAGAEQLAQFRREHGLDRPLHERYFKLLAGIPRGDLGQAFKDKLPVTEVIATRLPRTLLLGSMTLLFELLIGLGIGLFAAVKRNTWFDTGVMATAFAGISAPSFVTGLLFLNYLAFRLGWFPVGGYGVSFLDHVRHAMLPAFTLAIIGAATYARVMRGEMIETLRMDYVRTARAKGVGEWGAVLRHAARNALLPIVTLMGLNLTVLVSGAIITEQIYGWPGMGRLAVEAIFSLDVPIVIGVVIVFCVTVQIGNLLGDLAVAALDPRIRLQTEKT
jgi:peptide/nickel transport system permease protein